MDTDPGTAGPFRGDLGATEEEPTLDPEEEELLPLARGLVAGIFVMGDDIEGPVVEEEEEVVGCETCCEVLTDDCDFRRGEEEEELLPRGLLLDAEKEEDEELACSPPISLAPFFFNNSIQEAS